MNRLKIIAAALLFTLPLLSCASYSAYQNAQKAEQLKDWDAAVTEYEKALDIDPDNRMYVMSLSRAKREASREHFEKGKTLRAASETSTGNEQLRLAQLAATELELTIKLDPTNQFAVVEYGKAVQTIRQIQSAASQQISVAEVKERAAKNLSKAQPPQLNPAAADPISLSFPRETPVKDIYRALGNAFGINVLFDQAVKDDRITIELRDVTAQQALERVMQAANHFYKVLDEKTIIVVPDNPQARRDYEDLVIRTFYLSNGDAEQVTNVVRTMIEARNVFPLKALNAITIRDTADKVRIAEKIIEANDKAKAEVVVNVELLQIDVTNIKDLGAVIGGLSTGDSPARAHTSSTDDKGVTTLTPIGLVTGNTMPSFGIGSYGFTLPTISYAFIKGLTNSETLANPELRISEGEKATLHIGRRVPVPIATVPSLNTGTGGQVYGQVTSYQYQDIGIKVAIEPRVHHNREVTLKLTVEVSDIGADEKVGEQTLPSFNTRTIEATIRLKDGETNFLAGLIQENNGTTDEKTPFLGDLPFIGRIFTKSSVSRRRTDLMLTMTPHVIRIPDITEDDLAPMWVGTTNNLTFRGVSPRIESQTGGDPFVQRAAPAFNPSQANLPLSSDGEPGNYIVPDSMNPNISTPPPPLPNGPTDPFRKNQQPEPQAPPPPNPESASATTSADRQGNLGLQPQSSSVKTNAAEQKLSREAALRLSPRISPQPTAVSIKPGESRLWTVVGLDLDGLTTSELLFHFDPRALDVTDVSIGPAMTVDQQKPPVITVNRQAGTIRITSSDSQPLAFHSGGDVVTFRVHGGLSGETFLIMQPPDFRGVSGEQVVAAVSGGKARVE